MDLSYSALIYIKSSSILHVTFKLQEGTITGRRGKGKKKKRVVGEKRNNY